jgi:hypothetical protein
MQAEVIFTRGKIQEMLALGTPWRHMGKYWYNFTHSYPWQCMGVVSFKPQLFYPQYSLNKRPCGHQSSVGNLGEEVHPLALLWITPQLLSPWPSQYSNYIILTPSKQEIKLKILFGRRLSSTVGYYWLIHVMGDETGVVHKHVILIYYISCINQMLGKNWKYVRAVHSYLQNSRQQNCPSHEIKQYSLRH